jgi:type I restriction enzyme S subunit
MAANGWSRLKIGSIGKVITGKTPSTANPKNYRGPYPFITIPNLDGRVFIDRTERTLSEIGANSIFSCLLPPGAVMMSCIATIGRCGVTTRPSFTNQQINSVICRDDVYPRYLYYCFTQLGHALEAAGGGGSVYTNVSKSRFSDIEVDIPPIEEQRAIAHILGTLDDKIELNRRMNKTLEAMARALFKSWFIDFDPVRAKMEGRWRKGEFLPGLPAHLWDLFPDRLVDWELGMIPEAWRRASLEDEVQVVKGVSYRSGELADSNSALVTLKSINRGGGYRSDGLKPYTGKYKPEQAVTANELIVAQTDVTQAAEVIGKPALVLPDDRFQVLVASLDVLIIRPTKGDLPREFFYLLFLTSEFQDHIYGHTNGTTVLHLSKTGIPSYVFVRPPTPVAHAFVEAIVPLFQRIAHNEAESRTLVALRDALLPKIISGEIRVTFLR